MTATARKASACSGCGCAIVWRPTNRGARIALDADVIPMPSGQLFTIRDGRALALHDVLRRHDCPARTHES